MSFADQLTSDWLNVFANLDEFAQSVTYTQGEVATTVTVILDRDDRERPDERAGDRGALLGTAEADLFIGKDADNAGIATPTRDDTLTIDGEVWTVVGRPMDRQGCWQLRVRHSVREETAPGKFRMIGR